MLVSSNTCRFCLILVDKENVPLFYNDSPRKVMDIADVQVSEGDGLPNVICPSCFAQLELSHQFKLQVEKADKILREEININAVLRDESEIVECKDEIGECKDEIVECKGETVECRGEIVECRDEIVECKNVENENAEIATNCVFQQVILLMQETNTNVCALEHERNGDCVLEEKRTGDKKEMHTGEAEENHENDEAEKTLNRANERNANTGHSCESEANIAYEKYLSNDGTYCNNSFYKEVNSVTQKFKGKHLKESVCNGELCDANFKLRHTLNFRRLVYNGNHKCQKCDKVFSSRQEMESHNRIHVNECRLHVTCTVCGKVYKSKKGLELHVRKQHTYNVSPYICEICGKCYTYAASMRSHKVSHVEGKQPLTCEVCKKTYPHARALRVHKRYVHLVSKRFHCDICGKDFKQNRFLKEHKDIHSGERPHVCRICGFASVWRTAVRNHMKVHTGLESYCCEYCGQGFKWKQTYDKHVLKCLEKLDNFEAKSTETSNSTENSNAVD